MKDIQIIGGDLSYDKIQVLLFTYDRIQAIFYHCRFIENYCSLSDFTKAKWHFRSTLSEFKSLFDVLPYDLRRLDLDKIWERRERSKFLKNLERESDVLIQILKKTKILLFIPLTSKEMYADFFLHILMVVENMKRSQSYYLLIQLAENTSAESTRKRNSKLRMIKMLHRLIDRLNTGQHIF